MFFFCYVATFLKCDRVIILLVDFNCVCTPEDSVKGAPVRDKSTLQLSEIAEQCGLVDVGDVLRSTYVQFTHIQQQSHARLDRICVAENTVPLWANHAVKHVSHSDHSLVMV